MEWLAVLVVVALVAVALSSKRNASPPPDEGLVTVLGPCTTMPAEFQFEPTLGIRNNPPMLFCDYAMVSRYVGGTQDYSVEGGVFSSRIDTTEFPYEVVKGGGPQRILQIANELPLQGNVYSFSASVPDFSGDGVAQLTFVLYAQDGSGKTFAVVFSAWDNRYDTHEVSTMYDYQVPFVSTPLRNTRYCTLMPDSATMFTGNSANLRTFRFTMTDENLRHIIDDLNVWQREKGRPEFLPTLAKYQLGLTGILQEIFLLTPYQKVKNTVRFSGIEIMRKPIGEDVNR
jgi:hypothetical protein